MNEFSGLPAAARQNPFVYFFIFLIIAGCLIFIAIHFVQKRIKAVRTSEKWIKMNSTRPTTLKDVNRFAKNAELTKEEKEYLWELCREHNARNIEYLSRSREEVDLLFKTEYQDLNVLDNLEDKIELLFKLRYKIEKLREKQIQLKTSKSLHPGLELTFYDNEKRIWKFKLAENSAEFMKLSLPAGFVNSTGKPAAFTRIKLSLSISPGRTYKMLTRVVRYEKDKDDNEVMIVTATNMLEPILKRNAKRMQLSEKHPCLFSAVHIKEEGSRKTYQILEKQYKGTLLDVSATGCCLKCNLPIKKGQLIKTDFSLGENTSPVESIGNIIVTNRVPGEELYILHIEFIEIQKSAQNDINAHIYGYNPV